jgi:hypothetical protein
MAPPMPPLLVINDNSPTPFTIPALPSRRLRSAQTRVTRLRIHNRPRATPLIKTFTSITLGVSPPSDHTLSTILVRRPAPPALHTGPTPTHLSSTPTPNSHNIPLRLPLTITNPPAITGAPILRQKQRLLRLPLRRPFPSRMHPQPLLHQFTPRHTPWTRAVLIFLHQHF